MHVCITNQHDLFEETYFPHDIGSDGSCSDLDVSLDSIIPNTVNTFMNDVSVEANFSDSAYETCESEDDTGSRCDDDCVLNRIENNSGQDASDCDSDSSNSDTEYSEKVPFKIKKSSKHSSIYLPVNINGITVDALIDTGAQSTVLSVKLAQDLGLKTQDVAFIKGATSESSIKAEYCPKITFKIGSLLYKWHCLVAPIEDDFILGLDFLLKYNVNILVSNGMVSIGNKYDSFDASHLESLNDETFEVNKVVVGNSFSVKPWTGQFVRIPYTSKLSNWKVFEGKPFRNVIIPNTVFNAKDGFLTILVLNLNDRRFKIKCGKTLGVATDIFDPELSEECFYEPYDNQGKANACPTREAGTQVNFEEIKFDSVRITSIKNLLTIKKDNLSDCFPAKKAEMFKDVVEILPEHIRDLFIRSVVQLTFLQSIEVACLFMEYAHVFSKSDLDIGLFKLIKHRIRLFDYWPLKFKLRPTPFHFQGEEEQYIKGMLNAGVIQPSSSDWAAPVCLVRKRCGGVRVCTDYRGLNKVTIKDAFPLPRISDCLDTLAGNQWFSNIDMASGYYQVEVDSRDRHLTAFVTKYGLYEYIRMPFGLSNAPATFQRIVELVLSGLLWKKAVAYLDDVTILGSDFSSALSNLREVLSRFGEHSLKLKPKKCHLFQKSIEFLGRVVDSEGVSIKPAHMKQIEEWPLPTTKKELESFLGFVNYHRDYVPKYAHVSEPLYKFVSKSSTGKITLSNELIDAVDTIKRLLAEAPVLKYPNQEHPFILDTDASDTAIGGELLQVINDHECIVCFGSFVLTPEQRKYCTTRKELLAVVRFTRQFRHYLLGCRFIVRTDHNSLVWLLGFKNIEGQLSRWIEELSQYDMAIIHRPGKLHINADALSRMPDKLSYCENFSNSVNIINLPCYPCKFCERAHKQWSRFIEDVDYVVPLSIRRIKLSTTALYTADNWGSKYSPVQFRSFQENDTDLSVVITWLETDYEPTEAELALSSPNVKHLWLVKDLLFFQNRVLYYKFHDILAPRNLLVVPQSLKTEILEYFHDHSYAGHMGRDNTIRNIKKSFYWYQVYSDVAVYVKTCAACSKNKKSNKRKKAALRQYHAGSPMERVHLDILGPFNISTKGNRYVLVMVDQFTKWLECVPLPDQSAEKIAISAVDNFFCTFGMPFTIHTDQGANFVGSVFKSLCDLLNIRKTQTTPYHPQSNGQVERYNRTIIEMIRCLKLKSEKDWDVYLTHITSAIRCLENPSTGFSANRLMLGREVNKPVHVHYGLQGEGSVNEGEYVKKLDFVMRETHKIARDNLKGTLLKRKRDYDVSLKQEIYDVGDFVYKLNSATKKGVSKKLLPIFDGPFVVTRVMSPILIEIENSKRKTIVHHDKLKHCDDRVIPLWLRRRRQELLSLDDTLPYDEDEHSYGDLDISDLFSQDAQDDEIIDSLNEVDQEILPSPQPGPAPVTIQEESQQSFTVAPKIPVKTRAGRQIKENTKYSDYITYQ